MKKAKRINVKPQQHWTWVILVAYVGLSLAFPIAGLLGLLCMITPMALAAGGQGKLHCSHLCPRGSFFSRFLRLLPWPRLTLPAWMKRMPFKLALMAVMFGRFGWLVAATWGNPVRMAAGIGGFMVMSMIVGAVMGMIFPARAWCQVCPMGTLSGIIDRGLYPKAKPVPVPVKSEA